MKKHEDRESQLFAAHAQRDGCFWTFTDELRSALKYAGFINLEPWDGLVDGLVLQVLERFHDQAEHERDAKTLDALE